MDKTIFPQASLLRAAANTIADPRTGPSLLVPFGECRWDVNQDGAVNSTDYTITVNAAGACPSGAICSADVNDDCQVDSTDATQVSSHIGTCGDCGCEGCPESFGGQEESPVAEPMDEELMAIMVGIRRHEAIINGAITDEQIITALQEDSDEAKLIALLGLLGQ